MVGVVAALVMFVGVAVGDGGRQLTRLPPGGGTPTGNSGSPGDAAQRFCEGRYPAVRDPRNPLMLSTPPGSDPLFGARFFVNGPRHGAAAGAIADLLHLDPVSYPDDYSWQQFAADLSKGSLKAQLDRNPALRHKVQLLEKIARQPEEQRFSLYSAGGGPGKVYSQVQKFLCYTALADPGSIPIFTTFFLYQAGYCETRGEILHYRGRFQRQVREMAEAIGRRPAVLLLELDAIGSSSCMARNGALGLWEDDLGYEISQVAALPHTVVYVEAGYSDANDPGYTARALNKVGIRKIRGFFTNDTHSAWTIQEIRWARAVSALTGGAHIIVNTATNGRGPKLNPDPATQGIEDLCNAPGRGVGPRPTADTGFPGVDAFLWSGPPGNSSGPCRGGPPGGVFWPARAIDLAAHAQGKIGPGYPRDPCRYSIRLACPVGSADHN
jgi:endoglucanase